MNAKKILRKVHLWLSVPFGIILVAVGFSGAMLSFETEISEALRPELYFVEPADGQPIPVGRLVRLVASELPDSVEITEVTTFPDSRRAYRMSLSKPRRSAVYMVHTGSWGGIVMRIVNCLSALMAAVFALTGYYLWIARSLRRRNPAARH